MNTHNGTHVDAPLHFVPNGETVDTLSLDALIGPATVVDVGDVDRIDAQVLEQHVPAGTRRLLLRTKNSTHISNEFTTTFVALTADASQWIADHNIDLVGIDYLSIALYKGDTETHTHLLSNGVVIVEGLVLTNVEPGEYDFACLPLLLEGAEGAPARAVIRKR
jgi:arylformamidase